MNLFMDKLMLTIQELGWRSYQYDNVKLISMSLLNSD